MNYTPLIAAWNSATQPPTGVTGTGLTGLTTAQKLAAVNAWAVAGPNIDVPASAVVGHLILSSAYLQLQAFALGTASGVVTHDNALNATKMLMAIINMPNAPPFQMSVSANYTTIKGMMDAILAQETAVPGSTGFTQAVHDGLLALCATTQNWCQANGYPCYNATTGALNASDLLNAGGLS